jgi:AmiR/NasT family two-component response regulator
LISGLVDPSLADQARLAGAAALLLKPLDSEAFLAAVDRAASRKEPAQPTA